MEKRKTVEKEVVLILSEEKDHSTHKVMDWLVSMNENVVRINNEDEVHFYDYVFDDTKIDFRIRVRQEIDLAYSQIKSYWYRRGNFHFPIKKLAYEEVSFSKPLEDFLNFENQKINQLLHRLLIDKPSIGSIFHNSTNKLYNLLRARDVGLKTPATIITSKKKELIEFFTRHHGAIISKAIGEGISEVMTKENASLEGYASTMEWSHLQELPKRFFPTLFQERLEKKWEIRTFYLDGEYYSSAIFSQSDPQTKVDFRRYNTQKENRTPPFKLPTAVNEKLKKFMLATNMNSGVVDMVYTSNGEFYFLEVNPVGQFDQISVPCNYYLEEIIAKKLQLQSP